MILWLAFLAGITGAHLWYARTDAGTHPSSPASFSIPVGPTPLPLVAGVDPADLPLPPAPLKVLEDVTAEGTLPRISADGLTPLAAYAYPFDTGDKRPRISVILFPAGAQTELTAQSLRQLPGAVGVAFSLFTPNLEQAMAKARAAGHETLLSLAAETRTPTVDDPGPGALRGDLGVEDNLQLFRLMLGKGSGYVGVLVDPLAAAFDNPALSEAFLDEVRHRGLAVVTADPLLARKGSAQGAPLAGVSAVLDPFGPPSALDRAFSDVEAHARSTGRAILLAPLYPVVVERLRQWLPDLAPRHLALAPVSALVTSLPASADSSAPPAPPAPPASHPAPHP